MQISDILRFLDRDGFRELARSLVFIAYMLKGRRIKFVNFNTSTRLWEYQIGEYFFVTKEAAWFSSYDYYLQTIKRYSCYYYLPKANDIVIDIGAGVGEEILPLSVCVGVNGSVYGLEANPRTFGILEYTVSKNKLNNAHLFNLAISSNHGKVLIEDNINYGVANSISTNSEKAVFPITSMSLDQFVADQNIERIDFLKANIEGAEQLLIKGMNGSLSKIRNIAISCHDFRFHAGEDEFFKTKDLVIDFLSPHFNLFFQRTGDAVRDNYVYGVNKVISN
jgi:FkbM family methyltransferase